MKRSGCISCEVREYEKVHARIAQEAAAEGIVLLKNEDDLLPLSIDTSVALFGAGASKTIKGGTGSGDVNNRHSVSVIEGLEKAGVKITTRDWIRRYDDIYAASRNEWKETIWKKADAAVSEGAASDSFIHAYFETPFFVPAGDIPKESDKTPGCDTAIYVLSRVAGEGSDRSLEGGDYTLSETEKAIIKSICGMYENVILIINTGGAVDLSILDEYKNIKSVLLISQPGQEGGAAVADVLLGNVSPSGRLTASWPYRYEDIPFAEEYSYLNGDLSKDYYKQGIYVGYRYFDTYSVPVRYGFGEGLSYTQFNFKLCGISKKGENISVEIVVINSGSKYSGKEVIELYAALPQGKTDKEYRRLVGFAKTDILAPKEMETVTVTFNIRDLASFNEADGTWVIEEGICGLFAGESLAASRLIATLAVNEDIITQRAEQALQIKEELKELDGAFLNVKALRAKWIGSVFELPFIEIGADDVKTLVCEYGSHDCIAADDAAAAVDSLNVQQIVRLCMGDFAKDTESAAIGAAGIRVPGAAAQTSSASEDNGIPCLSLADGPAGVRLTREYETADGKLIPRPAQANFEGGFLMREEIKTQVCEKYYQFCTAFPVGTALAQSWNTDLVHKVGKAVSDEMKEFGVSFWLAPGMNIQKNPLCGRNFEYYSEDPYLSGMMAAAITKGVQENKECAVTIKHFACNSQENNRMGVDAVISERALREIYLRGFEIAVKESRPCAIMTSYNLINGVHSANNYDLCTKLARDEWGFDGLIMTDWTTTNQGPDCTASGCMRAGNDLVMPGSADDYANIMSELESGSLRMKDVKRSAGRLVRIIKKMREKN